MAGSPPITVIGVADDRFDLLCPEARAALAASDAVVGGRRHLWLWQSWSGRPAPGPGVAVPETLEIGADVDEVGRTVRQWADGRRRVSVLASGDPGFFGIVRSLLRTVDRRSLRIIPAPSSVSVAFARLGLPWDDATVVSAHGRPLEDAVAAIRTARTAAVLTSPDAPPEALGKLLLEAGVAVDLVAVCSRLGSTDELVRELSLAELGDGRFDPLSVVVVVGAAGRPLVGWEHGSTPTRTGQRKVLAWGSPEGAFDHRAGMITKSEVRSVVLGKLALPPSGVVWDVGAGSGSVAVDCALVQPALTVLAIEHRVATAARISTNATSLGARVHVVPGRAPGVLSGLPAPDRAFVGGGGIEVLDAVVERLRPGGRVVATFAALDRAAAAAERLGHMVEVSISRAERLPDAGWRLAAQNPVFVAWGPE